MEAAGIAVEAVEVAAEAVVVAERVAGVVVAAEVFAGFSGAGAAGFKRSPTVSWCDAALAAAGRDVAFGAAFAALPDGKFGDDDAGLVAACAVVDAAAGVGVNRSPMVGIAARGDAVEADVVGTDGDCVADFSVARPDAGRNVGEDRSLPSGGGLDPVTTGCPLLQAALSTLERSPPNEKAMFADSARSAQCWDGGKSTQ